MIKTRFFIVSLFALSFLGGCAGMLPSVKQTTKSPWQHFADAKKSFDTVIPNQTRRTDLKKLGFDPFSVPNVKLVTYLELMRIFLPNQSITMEDIDPGVRSCLETRDACQGYQVSPEKLDSQRYGSVFLDLLNFRRKTMTTGWKFQALFVLKDGLVVHKVWGGQPRISQTEEKRNPLGPLQTIGNVVPAIKLF
jgi:hypothetical protein